MLTTHEQLRVPDENKENDLILEVNWNPKDDKTNNCKMIRVVLPDGKVAMIRKEHLVAVLFAMGNEEEQRKMIPQTLHHVRWYETILSVRAKKTIEKGELITFPIKLSLPSLEQEALGQIKKDVAKSQFSLT
jgi:hypothetical protein